jgi:hypothetical protein
MNRWRFTVGNTVPTPVERLRALLDPVDGPEKSLVTWLGTWDEITPTLFADMVERAVSTGRAQAYELGWAEGIKHGQAGGQP